jgi:glycosyltransferase involved in cell wall biosynthesis
MTALARLEADTDTAAVAPRLLLRVLYAAQVDPSRKFGSMEEQAFLLASAFRGRGGLFLPVFPAAPEAVGRARYEAAGLEISALDLSRFRLNILAQLLQLTARHGIEVVHWNFYPPLTNCYVWALSIFAPWVKHYFTDHNSRQPDGRPARGRLKFLKRILLKRYARVVGVSRFVTNCLRDQQAWPAPDCLLHFINTDHFAPDAKVRGEVRRRLDADGRFVLLTTAYLIQAKGVDTAVRALAKLPESVTLWVVGDGPELAALQALSREIGVQDRVRFLGLQSRVEPYMQAADIFVCPSLWAEAAGLVNLEAQACGLPVLASRVGGTPEYVMDGRTGVLFPPGDFEGLAIAVRRLLNKPECCQEMGREARALAVRQFSAAARLSDYLDLYRSNGPNDGVSTNDQPTGQGA